MKWHQLFRLALTGSFQKGPIIWTSFSNIKLQNTRHYNVPWQVFNFLQPSLDANPCQIKQRPKSKSVFAAVYVLIHVCLLYCPKTLVSPSVHQQKSLPALRLSLLNSQQSLTQPPQQGVKTASGGTPPAMVTGPAVRVHHPNSVSTTGGASALPTGTLGHAGAMVCMMRTRLWILFWTVIAVTHLNMKLLTDTWNGWKLGASG